MESHLHTLDLVKCNNEHKIIKRRAKAICWELYKSRLELECRQISMGNAFVLKAKCMQLYMQYRYDSVVGTRYLLQLWRHLLYLQFSLGSFISYAKGSFLHLHRHLPEVKEVQILHWSWSFNSVFSLTLLGVTSLHSKTLIFVYSY